LLVPDFWLSQQPDDFFDLQIVLSSQLDFSNCFPVFHQVNCLFVKQAYQFSVYYWCWSRQVYPYQPKLIVYQSQISFDFCLCLATLAGIPLWYFCISTCLSLWLLLFTQNKFCVYISNVNRALWSVFNFLVRRLSGFPQAVFQATIPKYCHHLSDHLSFTLFPLRPRSWFFQWSMLCSFFTLPKFCNLFHSCTVFCFTPKWSTFSVH
jgi:hypothetical protein